MRTRIAQRNRQWRQDNRRAAEHRPAAAGSGARRQGAAATRAQLEAWVSYALRHGALLLFDAAYEAYITQPRKVVPGGKMKYDGLDDGAARADIIAYLMSLK